MLDSQAVQGSLFEEDYLIRTLGSIAHQPDIALTELVANAWDAAGKMQRNGQRSISISRLGALMAKITASEQLSNGALAN